MNISGKSSLHDSEQTDNYKELYLKLKEKYDDVIRDNVEMREKIRKLNEERMKAWDEITMKTIEISSLNLKIKTLLEDKNTAEYINRYNSLVSDNKLLRNEVKELRKLNGVHVFNERGAGRKPKFRYSEKQKIIKERESGMKIRELATLHKCSIGTIRRILADAK